MLSPGDGLKLADKKLLQTKTNTDVALNVTQLCFFANMPISAMPLIFKMKF